MAIHNKIESQGNNMKTISDYTIYCTPEQTKKAFELGAPIDILPNYTEYKMFPFIKCSDGNERPCVLPTVEEMIGWLEEQGLQISIMFSYRVSPKRWNYDLDNNNIILFEHNSAGYPSRKEATLAAIDAALEYLSTSNLIKENYETNN